MKKIQKYVNMAAACILLMSFVLMFVPAVAQTTDVFTSYDSFPLLDFESTNPSSSTWGGTIDMRFVKNDYDLTAHTGSGALYNKSSSYCL